MFGNKGKSNNGGGDFSGLSALFINCTLKRSLEMLHQPQHHLRDVESDAYGADAARRGRLPGARQSTLGMGCRRPLRLRQSRIPLNWRDRAPGRKPSVSHEGERPWLKRHLRSQSASIRI